MNKLELFGYGQAGVAFPEVNVRIRVRRPSTGEVIYDKEKHNRVLKLPLFTLLRSINGEFSKCDDETIRTNKRFQLYNLIPRYLAFGSGKKEVDINDTKLDQELNRPRMKLIKSNSLENRYESPFIKITIKHFVPLTDLVGETLSEAGLFCESTGDTCWARIVFDPFEKDDTMVVDVTWEITVLIIETEDEPYSAVDKLDLRQTLKSGIDYISDKKPDYLKLCGVLKEAIDVYASKTVSQGKIDSITQDLVTAMEGN